MLEWVDRSNKNQAAEYETFVERNRSFFNLSLGQKSKKTGGSKP